MKTYRTAFAITALLLSAATALLGLCASRPSQSPVSPKPLAYHDHPPTEPPPDTLDPAQFQTNRAAFVAYALAGQIKETLYQVPCYCGCNKEQGHKSLLDCFTGTHGAVCHICQKEALFCYVKHRKRKTPEEIREAMAKGDVAKFDLDNYVRRLYAQAQKSHE